MENKEWGGIKPRHVVQAAIDARNEASTEVTKAFLDGIWIRRNQLIKHHNLKPRGIVIHPDDYYELRNNTKPGNLEMSWEPAEGGLTIFGMKVMASSDQDKGRFDFTIR